MTATKRQLENNIIKHALEILETRVKYSTKKQCFTSPKAARDYVSLKLATYEHEVFACIWMDNRNRIIEFHEMFTGTIDGASVYPREVVKAALQRNAAAVILVHNHPSGIAEPSQADERITQRLKDSLSLIDVRVLDHLIVGEEVVSFAERGLL